MSDCAAETARMIAAEEAESKHTDLEFLRPCASEKRRVPAAWRVR